MTLSSSSGSLPCPATSAGSSGGASPPTPNGVLASKPGERALTKSPDTIMVSKVLTYSDVSVEVARTGRIVLPRIQVQQCLPELLRLCQAEHALPALRGAGPVKLSVDLTVEDEAGRTWVLLLKTWQNVVSGEHRPTFVLENTADFVRANGMVQGGTLAFCPRDGRMLLRTSLGAEQLPPRALGVRSPPAASTPEPPSHGRRRRTPPAGDAQANDFWQPQPAHAAEAAAALLQMHSTGSNRGIDAEAVPPSPLASTGAAAGPVAAAAGAPEPAATPGSHTIYRPQPVHTIADLAFIQQQQQPATASMQQEQPRAVSGLAAATCQPALQLLPLAAPASSADTAVLPPEALAQARAWLASVLAQQEQERRLVEQCNRLLLLQALHQEQRRRLAAGLGQM